MLMSCIFIQDIRTGAVPQNVADVFVENPEGINIEVWQTGLEAPWSLVFLNDSTALVSERPGRIRIVIDGVLQEPPYFESEEIHASGEGGLMGLAVHPGFPDSAYVYAMHTYGSAVNAGNRVIRLKHNGTTGTLDRIVFDGIPGSRFHNGGRIAFGPDGMLYIATGENFRPSRAQDMDNLGGKLLRVTPTGEIPPDNPFPNSPVYTLGHRNSQGLAWHPETGMMFNSEHGPSGEFRLRGHDMVNRIIAGRNYGWPEVIGKVNDRRYEDPVVMWVETTPPAGMTFWEGDLYLATLKSSALIRIGMDINGGEVGIKKIERWFAKDGETGVYGRLRDAVSGPDGALYVLVSNRDGRGRPHQDDDRILRITRSSQVDAP